jgi:hypothetical protein
METTAVVPNPHQYMIIPSTYSGITSVLTVVVLFVLYNIYIGYLACYNLKFYPNIYMLWNLLTSGNNQAYQREFEQYVRMVVLENQTEIHQETFTTRLDGDPIQSIPGGASPKTIPDLETGSTTKTHAPSWWSTLGTKVQMWWNGLILSSFVKGKTVKVSRRYNL